MKTALITGASSGIGEATARSLANLDYQLILCGRNSSALNSLKEELDVITSCICLCFDVRDADQVNKQISSLPESFNKIDVLINNAGNAHGLGKIQEGDISDWDAMMDINVKGLLYVSKSIIPGMVERNSGHIINIGSLAGKEVYANGTVYCASKHAVDAITEGMRKDLHGYKIKVGAVHPGLVETNFSAVRFKGDLDKASTVYKGYDALQASDIAEVVAFVVTRPPHVNVADLLVLPSAQASSTLVDKTDA
jgi:hypothetical protein